MYLSQSNGKKKTHLIQSNGKE